MKKPGYQLKDDKPMEVRDAALAYYALPGKFSPGAILGLANDQLMEPLQRVATFRKGLSKGSFDRLKQVTGLDYENMARALSVSSKTLQRKDVFDLVQSEKMYELATLYASGISYFGQEGFRRWMERPLFSLGNIKPIDLIDVSEGVDLLKNEIMRVQHGIAI